MTDEEERAFRKAARELIQDGGDDGGDIVIVQADQGEDSALGSFPPFSLLLFEGGKRGILVPRHLGSAPEASDRFIAILTEEAQAYGFEHAYVDSKLLN